MRPPEKFAQEVMVDQQHDRSDLVQEPGISVLEIARTLLLNWRVIVVLPVALAAIVAVVSLLQSQTYAASAAFVPEVPEGRSVSGAAALAQQFGISLGSGGSAQSPEFYVDLLRSTTILREAVESRYEVPGSNGDTLVGTLIDFYETEEHSPPLAPWRTAAKELERNISTSVVRESGIVELEVSASHPLLAEQIAERLLSLLHAFHLEVRQNQALEERRFIGDRVAEAHKQLLDAEGELQEFLSQNREFGNSPQLSFLYERLQRQVAIRQDVYTSLLRSEEEAQIDAVRDTPLFAVIDPPSGTAEPKGAGVAVRTVLAFFVGLLIALLVAFLRQLGRRTRENQGAEYHEFQELAGKVWDDLRRPSRWFNR